MPSSRLCAEHLQVLFRRSRSSICRSITQAKILLGEHTPATLGNFVIGPTMCCRPAAGRRLAVSVFDS